MSSMPCSMRCWASVRQPRLQFGREATIAATARRPRPVQNMRSLFISTAALAKSFYHDSVLIALRFLSLSNAHISPYFFGCIHRCLSLRQNPSSALPPLNLGPASFVALSGMSKYPALTDRSRDLSASTSCWDHRVAHLTLLPRIQ